MTALQRNQLVWLTDAAWQQLRARHWDSQAHSILLHWHAAQLPLVVSRQRSPCNADSISLGLPAPLQWERRKLALEVVASDIARVGNFPLLNPGVLGSTGAAAIQDFLQHLNVLHCAAHVYGSYGWQHLSGLPCVRDRSDLDLLITVPTLDAAGQVVWLLRGLHLGCRVDGELLFPDGQAVAWREFAQLIGGKVEQVLVKHRSGVQLLDMGALRARFRVAAPQAVAC
jgi:phosphoribosyl-dephospho-CoA transferase